MERLGVMRSKRTPAALLAAVLVASVTMAAPAAAYAAPQDELVHDTSARNYATAQQVQAGIEDGSIAVLYGKDYIDENVRAKMGVLIEAPGCFPGLTVFDNMMLQAAIFSNLSRALTRLVLTLPENEEKKQ